MTDIPEIPSLSHFITFSIFRPDLSPKYHNAIRTAINKAILASPKKLRILFIRDPPERKLFEITEMVIRNTGSSAITKLGKDLGSFSKGISSFDANNPTISIFTFRRSFPRKGPATIIAGKAIIDPYIRVLPRSALKAFTSITGLG